METTQKQKEQQESRELSAKYILESEFFVSIVVTKNGAGASIVGNGSKLITALLDDDFRESGKLLAEITEIRAILAEILKDFFDIKERPEYKLIRHIKALKDAGLLNGKATRDETSND